MMIPSLALLFVFVTWNVQNIRACSCGEADPVVIWCWSDFLIKARIIEERLEWNDGYNATTDLLQVFANYVYDIRILRVFKKQGDQLFDSRRSTLKTYGNDGLCGMQFPTYRRGLQRQTNEWLISGEFSDGEMFVSYCDFWTPWRSLPYYMNRGRKIMNLLRTCRNK